MTQARWTESIVSRLVVSFFVGGLALSVAFSVLEYDRALSLLRVSASQQLVMSTHNLQEVLREMIPARRPDSVRTALEIFAQDPRILSVKLDPADGNTLTIGHWPKSTQHDALWAFTSGDPEPQGAMDFTRNTVMVRSFFGYGKAHTLEVLIDGRYMHAQMRRNVLRQLSHTWLLLGVMMLAGLLVLRRWLAHSLRRLVGLVTRGATAGEFDLAGKEMHGEMGILAKRIARMLEKTNMAEQMLRDREATFRKLYLHAPSALIGLSADGQIREANARAAELLGADDPESLIGRSLIGYITPEDRTSFRRAIRRVESDVRDRCTLRVDCMAGWQRELSTELVHVEGAEEDGVPIRAALTDVTETNQLARSHSEQRHLLELLIDHMAEAVLVVGEDGIVTRASQKLAELVHRDPHEICGSPYDPAEFWKPLGPTDPAGFERIMREISHGCERHVHEQFDSHTGTFRFHVIPVRDESLRTVSRLWVVQEITAEIVGHRAMLQTRTQSRLMKRLGQELIQARDENEFICHLLATVRPLLSADAVGMALRDAEGNIHHGLWLDSDRCDVKLGRSIMCQTIERMNSGACIPKPAGQWVDIHAHQNLDIGLSETNLGRFVIFPIGSQDTAQGVIWLARYNNHPGDAHSIHILEGIAPILGFALHSLCLRRFSSEAKGAQRPANGTKAPENGRRHDSRSNQTEKVCSAIDS